MREFRFSSVLPRTPALTIGDGLIVLGIAALLYAGISLAFHAPSVVRGPEISLSLSALPWYAFLSVVRMAAAYFLSMIFSLFYGYAAARNRSARMILMPLLDILQSVPILSFLPVVLLSLTAIMPQSVAAEIAAIVLIFTSQAWNITFSFYQSMTTIPMELREAASIFRLDPWARFKTLELPFAAIGLLWNSMMSWSGGWFFLMAAEIFHVGSRDFRLPGLGSYLQSAASAGDLHAVFAGLATLVFVIVMLDQFVWRPLTVWADKFKVEMIEAEQPPRSWVFQSISGSWLLDKFGSRIWLPFTEWVDDKLRQRLRTHITPPEPSSESGRSILTIAIITGFVLLVLYGAYRAVAVLSTLNSDVWPTIGLGLLASFIRVMVSLGIALVWTVPVGFAIGTNRKLANILQPVVQVIAAIPATALFPIVLLALLRVPGGLNIAAIALMLMGTQWYLLFNVIAGASAIPQDLRLTTDLLQLSRWDRWRTLILPSLFPYIVTGAITAGGGAWNASIVAEHVEFGGRTVSTVGIGSLIAEATGAGDYALLLAGTLAMVLTVILLNRLFWQRLYRIAEERYRMD
ncbi:MAG: ABC transporter permease [Acidobacteria bacterium]|nr:MAG: ABC transporter permease [Acidobacteriota bacterium]